MKTESGLLPNYTPITPKSKPDDVNSFIENCKIQLLHQQLIFPHNDCNAHNLLMTLLQMKNKNHIIRVEKENWGRFKLFVLSTDYRNNPIHDDNLSYINGFCVSHDSLYIAYLMAIMKII